MQLVTLLESAIKRDCLSPNFETTNELLGSSTPGTGAENNAGISGSMPVLSWVPPTIAAVALRLMDLDASISYMLHQKLEFDQEKEAGDFIVSSIFFSFLLELQYLFLDMACNFL